MLLNGVGSVFDFNSNNGFLHRHVRRQLGRGLAAIMQAGGITSPSANYASRPTRSARSTGNGRRAISGASSTISAESGDARIPTAIRDDARTFGLDPSYYLDPHENDRANWMTQLYVREARALLGRMILEATDVTRRTATAPRSTNSIAMGSYAIDSHHVRASWTRPRARRA